MERGFMCIHIRSLEDRDYTRYEEFLLGFNESLLYYSIKYKLFLEELLNIKSNYLLAVDKNDEIQAILPLLENDLFEVIPQEEARIKTKAQKPDDPHYYYYYTSIVSYAKEHDYFFHKHLPRGWFRISFNINIQEQKEKRYDIIIPSDVVVLLKV